MNEQEILLDYYHSKPSSQNYTTGFGNNIDKIIVREEEQGGKNKISLLSDEFIVLRLTELLKKLPKKTMIRKKLRVDSKENLYFIKNDQVVGHFTIYNKEVIKAEDTGFFSESSDREVEKEIVELIRANLN